MTEEITDNEIPLNDQILVTSLETAKPAEENKFSFIENENELTNPQIQSAPVEIKEFKPKKKNFKLLIEEEPIYHFNFEELNNSLQKLIQKKILPLNEMRIELLRFAKEQSLKAISDEEYDKALQIDTAIKFLYSIIQEDVNSNESQLSFKLIQDRIESVESKTQNILLIYKDKINLNQEEFNKKRQNLLKQHEYEIQLFEEEWSKPEAVQPFSKPSTQLLQMKQVQKQYALNHDFESAKQIKLIAEELQKNETELAMQRASEAMKISYQQLLDKHQKELKCLEENNNRKINMIELEKEKEIYSNENTIKQLKQRINSQKIKKPLVTKPKFDQNKSPPSISLHSRSQLSKFNKNNDRPKLDIKLIDLKSIIKPKTASKD